MRRGSEYGSIQGFSNLILKAVKAPVKYATTGALAANTYSSTAQTLTANANGALSVDGASPAVNDRILVKNEAAATNNGWYVVTATGSAGAVYVLTRSIDANASAMIAGGDYTWCELGTANGATSWVMSNETFATLDTDALNFTAFSLGIVLAGDVTGPGNANTVVTITGSSGTATLAANTTLSGAAGTGALSFGSMTGAVTLPTGNLSWTGASTKTVSIVSTGAGSSITITAGAASTWSTSAGALTVNGASGINLQNGGTTWADLGVTTASTITLSASAPTIQWVKGTASPAISHAAQTSDVATTNLTVTPQAPFATATGANRTPGSLVVNISAPTNGGTTEGGLYVQRGGTSQVQVGPYSASYSAVWFGNVNLGGASTFSFLGNNDGSQTFLNNPTAGGTIFLRFANVANGLSLTSTTVNPAVDNAVTMGAAATRFVAVNSIAFNVYAAVSDGTAAVTLSASSGGQVILGPGGAGPQDARIRRTATNQIIFDDNAAGALLNIQIGGTASVGGGKGVIGIANANTNPTSNPVGGGILYANGGAGTWRGSSGTVTTFAAAGPHCGRCGYDSWRVAAFNSIWRSWHFECSHCGAEYKGGPAEVHDRLSDEQRREYLRDGMQWEDVQCLMRHADPEAA